MPLHSQHVTMTSPLWWCCRCCCGQRQCSGASAHVVLGFGDGEKGDQHLRLWYIIPVLTVSFLLCVGWVRSCRAYSDAPLCCNFAQEEAEEARKRAEGQEGVWPVLRTKEAGDGLFLASAPPFPLGAAGEVPSKPLNQHYFLTNQHCDHQFFSTKQLVSTCRIL